MNCVKLSDFIKVTPKPFILGAFLSRTMEYHDNDKNHYFYAYSSFKSSKFIYANEFNFYNYSNKYIEQLNKMSGWKKWVVERVTDNKMEVRFYIIDDIGMDKKIFYNMIYKETVSGDWAIEESFNDDKKDFLRGFSELRGSIDTTMKLIAQDYFYDDAKELKKALILTDAMNVPLSYANFNARELQPDYISGKKRNTQFRINLMWYASKIGFINEYKAMIFERAYNVCDSRIINGIIYYNVDLPNSKNTDVTFIKYLNFFTNNIYKKELSLENIELLRKEMNFNIDETTDKAKRNISLVKLFQKISPDECACCGTKTTFENKTTGNEYFEVHHMIPFYNGKELDNLANFVKLCPTCHSSLKKGRATKEQQIENILKIINKHEEVYEFCSTYLGIYSKTQLAEKIQTMLG